MTDAPKPSTWRRRKIIVAFVLVLVGVAWWNWPRGDARLVGKWLRGKAVFEFHADHRGFFHRRADGTGDVMPLEWWIDGDVLLVDPHVGNLKPGLSSRVEQIYSDVLDYWNGTGKRDARLMKYHIVSVQKHSITFRDIAQRPPHSLGGERTMTRIQE